MNSTITESKNTPSQWLTPSVDVAESNESLLLQVDLPGVAADAVNVEFKGGSLMVSGSRGSIGYRRAIRLSARVDGDAVSAELRHGVLTVTLPFAAAHRPRTIDVLSG
jgi:HSP20 family protein